MIPYAVSSSVVLKLSRRTGESHLRCKGIDVTCLYSTLRAESMKSDLCHCYFCRAELCLHESCKTMEGKGFLHIRFCPQYKLNEKQKEDTLYCLSRYNYLVDLNSIQESVLLIKTYHEYEADVLI